MPVDVEPPPPSFPWEITVKFNSSTNSSRKPLNYLEITPLIALQKLIISNHDDYRLIMALGTNRVHE